jgi:hypothetical protein
VSRAAAADTVYTAAGGDAPRDHRTEACDPDGPREGSEQRYGAAHPPDPAAVDGVLSGEDVILHQQPDPEPDRDGARDHQRVEGRVPDRGEHREPGDQQRRTRDQHCGQPAAACDQVPAADRARHGRRQHRGGEGACHRGGMLAHQLQVLAEVQDRAERDDAECRAADDRPAGAVLAKQPRGEHRIGGSTFDQHERDGAHHRDGEQDPARDRSPGERPATQSEQRDECGRAEREQHRPRCVDAQRPADVRHAQRDLHDHQSGDGQGKQQDEAPSPSEPRGVDDHAADERTAQGRDRHDRTEVPGVGAALTRAGDRAEHRLRHREQAAGGDALDRAHGDQGAQIRGEGGARRPEDEDQDRGLRQALLVAVIGELAPDRSRDRHGDERREHDPQRAVRGRSETGGDRRQCVGHDHRARDRGEQPHHEADEHSRHFSVRARRR